MTSRAAAHASPESVQRMKNIGSVEVPPEAFVAALSTDSDGDSKSKK